MGNGDETKLRNFVAVYHVLHIRALLFFVQYIELVVEQVQQYLIRALCSEVPCLSHLCLAADVVLRAVCTYQLSQGVNSCSSEAVIGSLFIK